MAKKSKRNPNLSDNVRLDRRTLWTLNAVPKNSVYGESLRRYRGAEWRRWDPFRSKLGAGIVRSKKGGHSLLPEPGTTVLYLGAAHGTTVSHIHDHLCGVDNLLKGRLVALDLSPRCVRDLNHLAELRPGLIPVLGDAREHGKWGHLIPRRIDWLFQDVAQAEQVNIFISACKRFLNDGGTGILSLKAASERRSQRTDEEIFDSVANILVDSGLEVKETINLSGLEQQHVLYLCKYG